MALSASEEALVRQLLDQQAAILSLAGNEATITSKLGATKVTLSDLASATSVEDTDLLLIRQGTTDKSVSGSIVKNSTAALYISDLQTQAKTAFTTAGTAPSYTVTTSPAYGALAANKRMHIKFHADGVTGSNTLNRDGLGALNLKQYDATGAKIPAIITANMEADVMEDGTDMLVLDSLTPKITQIQSISASVSSNALTISASAMTLDFRSTTLGSGAVTTVSGTPSNLVISSGSTLGTINATQSRIVVLAINNAGTIELAAVNISGGNQLDETNLISTTAEGGAGAADSANVIYSTAARTNVAYRVIGYIESTQATAGTWAAAPSTIQGRGGQALSAMASIGHGQTWQNVSGSRAVSTNYYNTTGKPIYVSIQVSVPMNATNVIFYVNGLQISQSGGSLATVNPVYAFVGGVVPPGASYQLGAGGSSITWNELR